MSEGLTIVDRALGEGPPAAAGDEVSIRFRATLLDGTPIEPAEAELSFRLDLGEVIPGLDQGVSGMRAGGRRTLRIPPELGYGDRGSGDRVPKGATLIFEVELLAFDRGPA